MFDSASDGYGPDRPHVAELLSGAGYATAGFQTNAFLGPTYNYGRGGDTAEDDGLTERAGTVYSRLVSEW